MSLAQTDLPRSFFQPGNRARDTLGEQPSRRYYDCQAQHGQCRQNPCYRTIGKQSFTERLSQQQSRFLVGAEGGQGRGAIQDTFSALRQFHLFAGFRGQRLRQRACVKHLRRQIDRCKLGQILHFGLVEGLAHDQPPEQIGGLNRRRDNTVIYSANFDQSASRSFIERVPDAVGVVRFHLLLKPNRGAVQSHDKCIGHVQSIAQADQRAGNCWFVAECHRFA